jgi:hypothetical protein
LVQLNPSKANRREKKKRVNNNIQNSYYMVLDFTVLDGDEDKKEGGTGESEEGVDAVEDDNLVEAVDVDVATMEIGVDAGIFNKEP